MKNIMVSALALGIVFAAQSASAATLINRDTETYKVTVVEGGVSKEVSIESSQELPICSSDCSLYVEGDPEPYELAAGDKVVIENGELFFDIPEENTGTPKAQ